MSEPDNLDALVSVRLVLEDDLGIKGAARVMLGALHRAGDTPADAAALEAFLSGPLFEALRAQVSLERASRLLTRLATTVQQEAAEKASTKRIPVIDGAPVPVLVAAGTRRFEDVLRTALGSMIVTRSAHGHGAELRAAAAEMRPMLLLVDCKDPPAADEDALAALIASLPDGVVTVLWAAEAPFGRGLEPQVEDRPACVGLRSEDGLAGLLDLVASRRR